MVNKKYSKFTRTRPNKGFLDPNQPENYRKEREEGTGGRVREKRLVTVFSFYSVDSKSRMPQ